MASTIKKLLLTAAAIAGMISLTACEGQNLLAPKPPNLNKLFNFTASVTGNEGEFSALFTRNAVGSWEITVTEPYELQGVTFSYAKGEVTASLDGLSAAPSMSELSGSPIVYITDALEAAVQDGMASVVYGDNSYAVNSGSTVLYFEQGSGTPKAFEISDKQIKGEISEFNITEEIFKDGADVVLLF